MKFTTTLKKVLAAASLTLSACAGFAQSTYPDRPVHLLVPYPPGGSSSVMAQLLSEKLKVKWGQAVIVFNRPGASGIIGTEDLLKLPPDGYTLLMASSTHLINPLLLPVPYDAIKDFAPVSSLYASELVLLMNPKLPANNLKEFIALAKSRPGQLNYASVSAGGTTHLAGETLNLMAGIKTQHVPYKGAGPALTDLIGGQVQFSFTAPTPALPFVKSGQLKALAVSGDTRLPALPEVPTFAEAGLPGFQARLWFGILARAGTPKEIVDKIAADVGAIMGTSEMKDFLVTEGLAPFVTTPEQFSAQMKADLSRYAALVKAANIKLEQ